ncbi:MAG: GNAT family N-acetyltransferase [Pirellulales bacterium]
MNLVTYRSTAELRTDADRWDDLWLRSDVTAPTMRAALIADWIDQFAAGDRLAAVAVEEAGQLVAALPLIARRTSRFLRLGVLPVDDWNLANDLLLDATADATAVCRRLVEGMLADSWSLFWFQTVPFETSRWKTLCEAMRQADMPVKVHKQYQVPVVEVAEDWAAYEASVPGDHRRSRRRYRKMMERDGDVQFEVIRSPPAEELERLLREGFEIEDRSWKGEQGTSLLRTPGMFDFYLRQAQQLAEWNQLALVFLKFDGRRIAFSYAWQSKAAHFCVKLGYDDAFRKYGPGQQLTLRLLEHLHETRICGELDFWGRLMPWNESWATRTYPLGRIVAAPPRLISRSLMLGYESVLPKFRKLNAAWRGTARA